MARPLPSIPFPKKKRTRSIAQSQWLPFLSHPGPEFPTRLVRAPTLLACAGRDLRLPNLVERAILTLQPPRIWRMSGDNGKQ
jgi:hypothetical protein